MEQDLSEFMPTTGLKWAQTVGSVGPDPPPPAAKRTSIGALASVPGAEVAEILAGFHTVSTMSVNQSPCKLAPSGALAQGRRMGMQGAVGA